MKLQPRILLGVLFFALAATAQAVGKPKNIPAGIQRIEVRARPVENLRPAPQQGLPRLEFIGGLELASSAKGFGGLSALRLDAQGQQAVLVSDAGLWLRFELAREGEKPIGVKNAELAPMLDPGGKNIAGTKQGDAESMALVNGNAFVGFEGTNVIWRYPLAKGGLQAIPASVPAPSDIKKLRRSRGLESLAAFPAGALLAIGEKPIKGENNVRAWIIDHGRSRGLSVQVRDDYQVSDAAFLDNGDLLLLERRFTPPFTIACRVRYVKNEGISGGMLLEGKTIFEAGGGGGIDNMEGIAAHKGKDGATYITMIADDNFSILQRTLLLRFKLIEK